MPNSLTISQLQDAKALITGGDLFQAASCGSSSSTLFPVDPVVGAYSNALNLQSFGIQIFCKYGSYVEQL